MIKELVITRSIDGSLGGHIELSYSNNDSIKHAEIPTLLLSRITDVVNDYIDKNKDHISNTIRLGFSKKTEEHNDRDWETK